jgi:hypothetical protein
MKTIKEEIRTNILPITLLFVAIIILFIETIFSKITIETTMQQPTQQEIIQIQMDMIEKCHEICQAIGLTYAEIDMVGIGYTSHKTEGRCICANLSIIQDIKNPYQERKK